MSFRNWHFQDWNQHFLLWDRNSSFSRVGFPSSLPGSHLGVEYPISLAPSPPIFFTLAWLLFARCKSDHIIFPHKSGDLCCPWIKSVILLPGDFFAFHSHGAPTYDFCLSSNESINIFSYCNALIFLLYVGLWTTLPVFGGYCLGLFCSLSHSLIRLYYTISRCLSWKGVRWR